MAVSKYIQQVQKAALGRPKSTEWYRDKIKELGTPRALDLIRDGKRSQNPFFGKTNYIHHLNDQHDFLRPKNNYNEFK